MKKLFLYISLFLPVALFAQDPQAFVIKGKIGTLNAPAKVYLAYQVGATKVIDSAVITNGVFTFSGNVLNPTNASMLLDHKGTGITKTDSTSDILNFYIEKGEIVITSPDSAYKAVVTGSKINDDSKRLIGQLKPINDRANALNAEKKRASEAQLNSADFQNKMETRFKELQIEQKAVIKMFILSNPNSYLSILALYSVGGPSPDPGELDTLYNSLSPELKNMEAAKVFKTQLDALRHTSVGVMAPDFTQNDVNGVPVKLSSFRGKYVLLDFWASWCGPCREENPNVVKAYNKYKDKNFTILSVSLDKPEGRNSWLSAIKTDGLSWTQVSDLKFWNNEAATLYSITSIPSNFLIDPNGKIVAKDLRGGDLENMLDQVLGK
ncbi:TlpA disulfide reductase family protein [Mucilaginibacter gotjawali]|uniref:Peroxiredoxin/fructose-specific component phosphotransferase system IIB-like protein n=1 Tax=Mucilaginibacter gotjawali TaxID=1550579 RepID=A0A839SA73_9SPHI|nr:TlpA disulfide reductase family protein [Mucilaginibacter gotjawali]MBB3054518.1 peroxiredoxin/fructose-specific component phosphotransferase system IIB-like protein [Mucilaginibacter gotjawali]